MHGALGALLTATGEGPLDDIQMLEPLSILDREHVLKTVATWFRIGLSPNMSSATGVSSTEQSSSTPNGDEKFSDRPELSAKDFIFEKDPRTESERLACLGYYLTHYQETPHFKTVDLSRLNTDAAQRKMSNPAVAANNAMRDGFFVHAPKAGFKQLSAMGERFVQALPERDAALQVKQRMGSRRKRSGGSRPESRQEIEDHAEDT